MLIRLNSPQLVSAREIFAPDGSLYRGRTHLHAWGRSTGKSWFKRALWWTIIAQWEYKLREDAQIPFTGVRIAAIAPTLKQWRDIHWQGILEELTGSGRWAFLGGRPNATTGQIFFPGGSVVKPFPAALGNSSFSRGIRTDILDADEFDDIDAEAYDAVASPWLSEKWSFRVEILGGTPTRGRHGLWYRTLEEGRLGARLRAGEPPPDDLDEKSAAAIKTIYASHATYKDVPEIISIEAVEKARTRINPSTFKREWLADPDAGEGLVYPFDETFHVKEESEVPPLNVFSEFIVGVDHGWTDPGCLLLGGVQGHGNDAILWILDEVYQSELPNHEWNKLARVWDRAKFWPDPSRPDRVNDFRSLGLRVGETDNNIYGGIARVADMMFKRQTEEGPPWARMYVSRRCKNTIREFGLYRFRKDGAGEFTDDPEDKNNHAMDALRYMTVGRFGRAQNRRFELGG